MFIYFYYPVKGHSILQGFYKERALSEFVCQQISYMMDHSKLYDMRNSPEGIAVRDQVALCAKSGTLENVEKAISLYEEFSLLYNGATSAIHTIKSYKNVKC